MAGKRRCDETRKSTCDKARSMCPGRDEPCETPCKGETTWEKRQISLEQKWQSLRLCRKLRSSSLSGSSPLFTSHMFPRWHVSRSKTSRSSGALGWEKQRGRGVRTGVPSLVLAWRDGPLEPARYGLSEGSAPHVGHVHRGTSQGTILVFSPACLCLA